MAIKLGQIVVMCLLLCHASYPQAKVERSSSLDRYGQCTGEAAIKIVVFSDYQCSQCRDLYLDTLLPLIRDYKGTNSVCVEHHDTPAKFHKYGQLASKYASAGARLGEGQWFAINDALFSRQQDWLSTGRIEKTVQDVLSPSEYARVQMMVADSSVDRDLERELERARQMGVRSTPTMFICTRNRQEKVVGFVPYQILKDYINRLVSRKCDAKFGRYQ
jgi:protein-disulfide isomerase